ncbi:MAG: carbohydrate binding domain-containing protein [Fimbriimonadaceae bacterium]|nr:carbohydrate binding domain-containing protein [Fimbriimonadaceae bacterium]
MTVAMLLVVGGLAQTPAMIPEGWFPFVIPWDDALKGTATDVSFLNEAPAGKNGPIVVRGGRFVESKTGKRIRFFGTNCGARAAFPSKSDADKIAAHMAKLGINIVRFHHLNNGWDLDGGTIWKPGRTFLEVDPKQLDKLDYFVAALKRHGIYSNINLQTAREYLPEMGFAETVRQIPNFQKKVDKFDRKMIALQKQYARDLLDRVNPYTKLRYRDDPALAVVEINNENSLVGWPGESPGSVLPGLPEPFRGQALKLWNEWLRKKYGSDARLAKAWASASTISGGSLIGPGRAWSTENQGGSDVTYTPLVSSGNLVAARPLRVDIRSHTGPNWHLQAHIAGLDLKEGQTYTVKFRARSDRANRVNVQARLDKEDWRMLGLDATFEVGPEWRERSYSFVARGVEPNHARVGFVLGDARGTLEFERLQLFRGLEADAIEPGQSLAKGNIEFAGAGLGPKYRDYCAFVLDTEKAYSEEMRGYLRRDLGFAKVNLIDTQVGWGGLSAFTREASMEFADNHSYWNHPVFLGADWDAKNYRVDRKALVDVLDGDGGALGPMARNRWAGKPYTVSEYNHPAPSDYQIEMMPLLATIAALQDWDGFYTFDYGATGTGAANDRIDGYFSCATNPAKAAFFPATALIFRLGQVPPLATGQTVRFDASMWPGMGTSEDLWRAKGAFPSVLGVRTAITVGGREAGPFGQGVSKGLLRTAGGRALVQETPRAVTVVGFLGGLSYRTPQFAINIPKWGNDFAALSLNPLDGQALAQSGRLLLTLGGRVENPGMGWNADRTSVSGQWGTGPSIAEAIPASVSFRHAGALKGWALDGRGRRVRAIPTTYRSGFVGVQTDARTGSMWVELAAK